MWEKRWRTAEREERRSTSVAKAAREDLEEAVRLRSDAEGVCPSFDLVPPDSQLLHCQPVPNHHPHRSRPGIIAMTCCAQDGWLVRQQERMLQRLARLWRTQTAKHSGLSWRPPRRHHTAKLHGAPCLTLQHQNIAIRAVHCLKLNQQGPQVGGGTAMRQGSDSNRAGPISGPGREHSRT